MPFYSDKAHSFFDLEDHWYSMKGMDGASLSLIYFWWALVLQSKNKIFNQGEQTVTLNFISLIEHFRFYYIITARLYKTANATIKRSDKFAEQLYFKNRDLD